MKRVDGVALVAGAGLAAVVAACSTSPSMPTTSLVAAHPTSPSTGSTFSYYSQPVTLVVTAGVATGGASPAGTVEVATDAEFTMIVSTQPLAAGQSTITLDHLSPSTTYYWHVKTAAADNPGVTSSAQTFSVGPPLVIQAPTAVAPLADTLPHKRPTFTVSNATRTGPAATLTYQFDVATDASFTAVVATGNAPEGAAQTSFTPNVDLTPGATYYWRARASDTTKGVVGAFSPGQMFTTVNPDDGTYRYDLTLQLQYLRNCSYDPGHPVSSLSFDASLAVSGDHLQYVVPVIGFPKDLPQVNFDLQRTGNQLSGTVAADFPWPGAFHFLVYFYNALASGETDSAGRLTGTIRGTWNNETFSTAPLTCDMQLGFVLTPH